MENNSLNKRKFYALYYGQLIIKIFENEEPHRVWGKGIMRGIEFSLLELLDIKSITDEHAKECGMLSKEGFLESYSRGEGLDQQQADFLRSEGYLIPWMDLTIEDIIQYGWAKIKKI